MHGEVVMCLFVDNNSNKMMMKVQVHGSLSYI